MPDRFSYLILGAGKQGVAAAYDVILHGRAQDLTLADGSSDLARNAVLRLRKLLPGLLRKNKIKLSAATLDARSVRGLRELMRGKHALLSALPYYLNPAVARAAVDERVHYCDLGGYFETTLLIRKLHARAKKAGVALVPDCGVSPGMCNLLALCGMELLDRVSNVRIYCGGLPQKPRPPLGYKVVFNLEGVIGNYFGKAYVLRNGAVALDPPLSGLETLEFDAPLGTLEAAVTGGATSTCPWTFKGRVRNYDYKTLRYPGHFEKITLLKDLGLLETDLIQVNGYKVSPRHVFVAAAGPRLHFPDDRDLLVQRVTVDGWKGGRKMSVVFDVLDYFDSKTGFTAMQRTTGFSAAIVLEMLARGVVHERGAVPLETGVPARMFLNELRRRGIHVKETVQTSR